MKQRLRIDKIPQTKLHVIQQDLMPRLCKQTTDQIMIKAPPHPSIKNETTTTRTTKATTSK